jgi:hypothetical protein
MPAAGKVFVTAGLAGGAMLAMGATTGSRFFLIIGGALLALVVLVAVVGDVIF